MKKLWKRPSALTVVGSSLATAFVAGVAPPASATGAPDMSGLLVGGIFATIAGILLLAYRRLARN